MGKQIKRALVYAKKEWHAFETVLQNGDVEVSNNLCEQMMKHIKMNLKNFILGLHNKTVEKKQLLPCYIRF